MNVHFQITLEKNKTIACHSWEENYMKVLNSLIGHKSLHTWSFVNWIKSKFLLYSSYSSSPKKSFPWHEKIHHLSPTYLGHSRLNALLQEVVIVGGVITRVIETGTQAWAMQVLARFFTRYWQLRQVWDGSCMRDVGRCVLCAVGTQSISSPNPTSNALWKNSLSKIAWAWVQL